jgi:hypothetical protein
MSEPKHVDIQHWRRGDLNMRLVINRSHGHARIMDYRVGNYEEKRNDLDALVRAEGLRKVFTLVEKQDSQNWRSVGFFKEAVYPAFFRTADAYAMSRLYDDSGDPVQGAGPVKPQPAEQTSFPGRKLRKPGGLKLDLVQDERSRTKLMSGLNGELRALPFGREEAPDLVLHARTRKREAWVLAEIDDSFGHATLGIAPPPAGEDGLVITAYACNDLFPTLTEKKVSNLFGLSPVEDRWSNELFAGLGFKVTGRLADHLRRGEGDFTTALVWHRRLIQSQSDQQG